MSDVCSTTDIRPDVIEKVKRAIPEERERNEIEEIFRTLGVASRIKVVTALRVAELCVCDLAELTDMTQSAVSHQLRVLRNMRLVKYRREGRKAFYSLDDGHVAQLLDIAFEHIRER